MKKLDDERVEFQEALCVPDTSDNHREYTAPADDAAKKQVRQNWIGLISTAYSHKVAEIADHILENLEIQPHRFVPTLTDEITALRAQLAEAAAELAEVRTKALAGIESFIKERDEAREAAESLRASLAAVIKERDEARAEVERLSKGYHESCIARAEALQAEVAALKGRKVTLPAKKPNEGYTRQGALNDVYNDALLDCAEAIRAAGVEVA
jgi:DNA repair exonuclease SbcCD ATPase subunit